MTFRNFLLLLLLLAITVTFSQDYRISTYYKDYLYYDKLYHAAEKLSSDPNYNDETEKQEQRMNQQALDGFISILPAIEKAGNDSLAFYCWFKAGTLQHYFDSLSSAQLSYQKAIQLKSRLPHLADSFLFKPYVFSGGIYYAMEKFDSALSDYKKAEEVASLYQSPLSGSNRLYNTLGVLYYETGNYRQAKNYFEKSISVLPAGDPYYQALLVNYKINLASTFTKLEEFALANSIYQQLLPLDISKNEILHNTGTVYLNLGLTDKAIDYFKQVKYTDNKNISLYNDLGNAYAKNMMLDSAIRYFQKALAENQKWFGSQKNSRHGLTFKYFGDAYESTGMYSDAATEYQKAIIQFCSDFNDPAIDKNPKQYGGVFSYINLFHTLVAKADALEKLYKKRNYIADLTGSLNAYQSAFTLADYVEKTYDSDEARLFLNKIKYIAHSKPIEISLALFDLTKQKYFLEEAYFFDQRNKASILSLNLQENEIRKKRGEDDELLKQESSLKALITRLSLKASQETDSVLLSTINASLRDYEIKLGQLQDKISAASGEKEFTDRIPGIKDLQNKLDQQTALLSYHLSDDTLVTLIISAGKLEYNVSPIDTIFFLQLDSFKTSLQTIDLNRRFSGAATATSLYKKLIGTIESKLSGINRLIIIPDDELNYLPFEALQDEKGQYLVQKFSIQYQYSTALLEKKQHNRFSSATLAFAPFTSKTYTERFTSLPASKEEVNDLKGKIFIDSAASKQNFMASANHYSVIHLATHATVNNETPLQSFIAFYPAADSGDYRLYAAEIYNMHLDSTQLIILSACETGAGKLVKGEGLMSLSRAFAYAGCPNIITSLWKAEDKTTAFISQRIHRYLDKDWTYDKALQQAKIDLLQSNAIDPRYKSPNYWAHLIFIGQYEPGSSSGKWWWVVAGVIVLALGGFLLLSRRKR